MKNKLFVLIMGIILVLNFSLVSAKSFTIFNSSNEAQEYLIVNGTSGNVGIGIENPTTILQLANSGWISAKNNAGTGAVNMFRVNSNDQIEIGGTLNIGSFEFSPDSGLVTFVDMPVTSAASAGTSESYVFKIDGDNLMTVYSESDGSGGIQNKRVGILTTTPKNTLNVVGDINATSDIFSKGYNLTAGYLYSTNGSYYPLTNPYGFYNSTNYPNIVNGSGTSGYIARFNATGSLNNSVIYQNGTNIGIGTTNTGAKLDFGSSGANSNVLLLYSSGNFVKEGFANAGYGLKMFTASDASAYISFGTVSSSDGITESEKMRITNSGNVGIGTVSPNQTLHVVGNSNVTGNMYTDEIGIATTTMTRKLNIKAPTGAVNDGIGFRDGSNTEAGTISIDTPSNDFYLASTQNIRFFSGSTLGDTVTTPTNQRMVITSAGNVGIGTVSPNQTLHVIGTANITSNFTVDNSDLFVNANTGYVGIGTTNPTSAFYVNKSDVANERLATFENSNYDASVLIKSSGASPEEVYLEIMPGNQTANSWGIGTNDDNNLHFGYGTAGTMNKNELMFINGANGNVGIGTVTTSYKLDVAGTVNASAYFVNGTQLTASSIGGINGSGTSGYITRWNGSGSINNSVIYENGSNIGIGTTVPTEKLTLTGVGAKIYFNSNGNNQGLIMNNPGNSYVGIQSLGVASGNSRISLGYNTNPSSAITEVLSVVDTGNVGINTTTPQNTLDVKGTFNVTNSTGTPAIVVNNLGKVGINLAVPSTTYPLSVNGTIGLHNATGAAGLMLYTDSNSYIQNTLPNGNLYIYSGTTQGDVITYVNATERFRITKAGNVGIGTNNPSYTLDVNGTTRLWHGTTSSSYYTQFSSGNEINTYNSTGSPANIYMQYRGGSFNVGNGKLVVAGTGALDSAKTGVYITSNGLVGINTTNPLQTLDVNGTVVIGDGTDGIMLRKQGTIGQIVGIDTGLGAYNNLDIRAGASTQLYLNTSGNVGINTTSPSTTLDVHGEANITNSTYLYNSKCATGQVLTTDATTGLVSCITASGLNGVINGSGTSGYITRWNGTSTINNSAIYESGGNIGIGTTSPSSLLHARGSGSAYQSAQTSLIIDSTNGYPGITLADNNVSVWLMRGADNSDNDLWFYRNSGDASSPSWNAMMVLDRSTGYVGINTTTPQNTLEVKGTLNLTNTAGSSVLMTTNAGNVGIGTVSPNNTFHVIGTGNISSNFTVDGGTLFANANSNYVGINTTNPRSALQVVGTLVSDNTQTQGTFTAGNDRGFGNNVYIGNMYRNVVDSSETATNWLSSSGGSASVDNSITNPMGQLGVIKIVTGTSSLVRTTINSNNYFQGTDNFVVSFWIKKDTGTKTGVYIDTNDELQSSQSFNVDTNWKRVVVQVARHSRNNGSYNFFDINGFGDAETYYLWGVQVEAGDAVTPYQKTSAYSAGTNYGLWAAAGGFGGTTKSPMVNISSTGLNFLNGLQINGSNLSDSNRKVTATQYCDQNGNNCINASNSIGTITGSGTSGYIPLWNGTTSLNSSIMNQTGNQLIISGSAYASSGFIVANNQGFGAKRAGGTTQDMMLLDAGDDIQIGSSALANDINFRSNTGNLMTILTAGNVGIGTPSPSEKFHVNGSMKIEQSGNSNAYITLNPYSSAIGTAYQWNLVATNSANSYNFEIREGSTPYVTVENSVNGNAGYVGIGTYAPSYRLDVNTTGATVANFRSSNSTISAIRIVGTGGTGGIGIKNNDLLLWSDYDNDIRSMTIADGGNVGIGANSPQQKLDVVGNANVTGNLTVSSSKIYVNAGGDMVFRV